MHQIVPDKEIYSEMRQTMSEQSPQGSVQLLLNVVLLFLFSFAF